MRRLKLYRGKWCAVWRENGTTRRHSLHTTDRGTAERRLKDLKVERPGDTIADAVTSYLAEKKGRARSYQPMQSAWKVLEPEFGALRPDQVNRDACRDYAKKRRKSGVGDGTIIKELGFLKAALNWAGKGRDAVWDFPSTPPPRERYLTKAEVNRLIDAAELPHVKLFILLAYSTAARASAVAELTWDRVDFDKRQIRLAKGEGRRKGRATVPMTERLSTALREAQEARTCEYVVEWGGRPVGSVKRAFSRAVELAGLKDVTPHVLRHSAAVHMVEAGISFPEVAQFLGHTNPSVTFKVYGRFSPTHLRTAAAALE